MQTTNTAQRRVGSKRSRAGCATCKRRRVKCDETPHRCLRCVKAHLQCEGYGSTTTSRSTAIGPAFSNKNRQPVILPKSERPNPLSTVRLTGFLPGETEVENRYFRYFQQQTTSGFQSAWDWTLWNRLVLQGSHHEPFMRYAVVAIGALHQSLRAASPTGRGAIAGASVSMAKLHRQFALLTYGKALNRMQLAISASSSPRQALIACLLIICFESHAGDRYKALTHAKHGVRILHQWDSQDRLYHTNNWIVDYDKITEAFKHLDIQVSTINDDRTVEFHEKLIEDDSLQLASMPDKFRDLDEAKTYFSTIMRRSTHFITLTQRRTHPYTLSWESTANISGSYIHTIGNEICVTSAQIDDVARDGERKYSLELSRWLEAFDPIFVKIRRTTTTTLTLRDYVIATMLQIQALTLRITLAGIIFTQEILFDQFHAEFSNIVRYAEDVVTVRNLNSNVDFWGGSFLVDVGLVAPLFTLLLRCRDPILRRQAIKVLESWHVECWWDPLMVRAISRFVMSVEEEGMVGGFIPESSRAIITARRRGTSQRGLLIQCVQRPDGVDGPLKWTEKFVIW